MLILNFLQSFIDSLLVTYKNKVIINKKCFIICLQKNKELTEKNHILVEIVSEVLYLIFFLGSGNNMCQSECACAREAAHFIRQV